MSKTILLADDSVTIRKVVELTFMDVGFDLISVGDGTEALDRLTPAVDLVIADVHMPGADGYEVCERVKRRAPGTPVLLLVGTFEDYDEHRASEVGADNYLKKPFDSQELLRLVHLLLEGSSDSVEPEAAVTAPSFETGDGESPRPKEAFAAPSADSETASEPVEPAAEQGDAVAGREVAEMSDESVDRIARRVVELLTEDAIRDVAWEVIPDLAEVVIKERLNELESQVE